VVSYPHAGEACTDGRECTTDDQCNFQGECAGTPSRSGTLCGNAATECSTHDMCNATGDCLPIYVAPGSKGNCATCYACGNQHICVPLDGVPDIDCNGVDEPCSAADICQHGDCNNGDAADAVVDLRCGSSTCKRCNGVGGCRDANIDATEGRQCDVNYVPTYSLCCRGDNKLWGCQKTACNPTSCRWEIGSCFLGSDCTGHPACADSAACEHTCM
jgi:hypothetical protein